MKKFLPSFLFLLFISINQAAASDMEIGRMRIAIWPEYDAPGVLVICDGRFVDTGNFPAETTFLIPRGSMISDACSLSPKGQHFCQLFTQKSNGEVDEVRVKLPYPNFYLSFHINPFKGDNPLRRLNYDIKTNHPIRKLEVDIQEPLRAEGFSIIPGAKGMEELKGFRHYRYSFDNQAKGVTIPFEINYKKDDNRPSVNIKYSPMSGEKVWGSSYEERGRFVTLLYILAATGFLAVGGMLWFLFRKKNI